MIDFNTIEDKVIQNKILIPNEDVSIKYKTIVFFIANDKIVYIGKIERKVLEYLLKHSKQFNCTHYFTELVNIDEIDNIIAELILNIQPLLNPYVPKNTQYITHIKAEKFYRIKKKEFQKYWENNGKLKFKNTLFLERKVFDDIFDNPEPYCEDMPKVGTLINSIEDIRNNPLIDNRFNQQSESYKDESGNWIQKIINLKLSIKEEKKEAEMNYKNLQILIKHAYHVTNIINSLEFEAYSEYKKKKQIFNAREQTWWKLPSKREQDNIAHRYLKSLELCK